MTNLLHQAAKAAGMKYLSGPQDFWLDDRAYDIEDPALPPLIASRLRSLLVDEGLDVWCDMHPKTLASAWSAETEVSKNPYIRRGIPLGRKVRMTGEYQQTDALCIAAAMQALGKWTEAQAREFVEGMK